MYTLPLFPLNTILFPGMPLHLHIFEDRYKQMMNKCLAEETPFGVVLIKSGKEVSDVAEPYAVGCTAHISQVQRLEEGRMNMSSVGQTRFRIHELSYDEPYLVGRVENLPFDADLSQESNVKGGYLQKLVQDYVQVLSSIGDIDIKIDHFPTDPIKLAYMAAMLLQSPHPKKQAFLEINTADQLVSELYDACRYEISVLRSMLNPILSPQQDGPFSLN